MSRPVWVGIVMKTSDGQVITWQMGEPLTINVSQEFSLRDPAAARTEFRINGATRYWYEGASAAPKEIENDHGGDGDRGFGSLSDLPHM